jgi:hypothetical protein
MFLVWFSTRENFERRATFGDRLDGQCIAFHCGREIARVDGQHLDSEFILPQYRDDGFLALL